MSDRAAAHSARGSTARGAAALAGACAEPALRPSRNEFARMKALPWWPQLEASCGGRVALVDGDAMFNRPGPRLVDAYEWLVATLQAMPLPSTQPISPQPTPTPSLSHMLVPTSTYSHTRRHTHPQPQPKPQPSSHPHPRPRPRPDPHPQRAAGTAPCRAARLPCRVGERQRLGGGGGGECIRTSAAASRRAGGGGGGAGGGGAERRGRHRGVAPVRGAAGPALVQGSQDRRPPVLTCACAPCATCGVWRGPVRGPTPRGCGSHALW